MAGAGSYTLSHIHFAMVETTRPVSTEEFRAALRAEPRVAFVRASDGLVALNSVIELMRDLGRPRGDMWEVAVWEDALAANAGERFLTYLVHNESIVVPETIDCIRALSGVERDGAASIAKTDAALGITPRFLSPPIEATGARANAWPPAATAPGFTGAEGPTQREPAPVGGKEQS